MDHRADADSGTSDRIEKMSPELAPIVKRLTMNGCLVGESERAIKDIKRIINKKIKINSAVFMVAMFIEAVILLLML